MRITNRIDTAEGTTLEIDGQRFEFTINPDGTYRYARHDLAIQGPAERLYSVDDAIADAVAYVAELAAEVR